MSNEEKEPSHALPIRFYRDPLEALIIAEAGTCKGCVRESTILGMLYCTKGRRHGRRCEDYVERLAVR